MAKIAMNQVDELLLDKKSRLILVVHDEFIFEIAEGEESLEEQIRGIMESVFPSKFLPLVVDASWSDKSLGDLA